MTTTNASAQNTIVNIDTAKSIVNWEAGKLGSKHHGTVKLAKGTITVENNIPVGGAFTVDMQSITDLDLNGGMKNTLETHLKSKDFFEVEKYPATTFIITALNGKGDNKYEVIGNLTIKDKTNPITIESTAAISVDGKTLTVKSERFSIDRTKWGVVYGSGSFFKGMADKAIHDEIFFEVLLEATIE